MLRNHRSRAGGPGAGPLRTSALAGLVVAALLLPLGGASAEQEADGDGGTASASVPAAPGRTALTRCGPELASPEGLEAQTCVLTLGGDTWARVYYRNTTGDALDAGLSLLGPDGRAVRTTCDTGADDAPATCETPRERTRGAGAAYTAVSEFARGAEEPLLLRSASNSVDENGS
ncbi:hypothetical protein EV284_4898 [Streptomyces sp. BK022]|uniref:hypothetical protein n=1 Tax=Streptomyces sp. BK022 TaxID=2512123 RepID=UPI001028FB07|nr:hypothetical protein [Streptomyces sp. BK022]RZU29946.1 hypothetical protein EV284_4898 [Streptomyces sp. BK022]